MSFYSRRRLGLGLGVSFQAVSLLLPVVTVVSCSKSDCQVDPNTGVQFETSQQFSNWSATHSCAPKRLYEPKSGQEVARLLKYSHENKLKVRPVGSALSPNGIAFSSSRATPSGGWSKVNDSNSNSNISNIRNSASDGEKDVEEALVSLTNIDYINVDEKRRQVTVGAGATVSSVLAQLKKHNLTLQNFSSIQEQQMAGWTQVSAHGTGISLPTVDEMIVRMKIAIPSGGILTLSKEMNPELFDMCKVGLGALGVVTELTLSCIPQLTLHEFTSCVSRSEVGKYHAQRLRNYRHVRYMWIPYSDTVVVVQSNPVDNIAVNSAVNDQNNGSSNSNSMINNNNSNSNSNESTSALINLLLKKDPSFPTAKASAMTCQQLREALLEHGPLDSSWIKQVNLAEAAFWKAESEIRGSRIADSTEILGFDCGGEQHVFEVCFPIGKVDDRTGDPSINDLKDVIFAESLLKLIEKTGIAAPCPIEQRWTCGSSSKMSPAYSKHGSDEVFSWVGIIMYLPPNQSVEQRAMIYNAFREYCQIMQPLMEKYNASAHWAKIEYDGSSKKDPSNSNAAWMRQRIRDKFPIDDFRRIQKGNDPNRVLSNDLIDYYLLD